MTVGGRVGALWIGGLEPYMDEAFLQVNSTLVDCQFSRIQKCRESDDSECCGYDGRDWCGEHQGDDQQVHWRASRIWFHKF